MGYLIRMYAVFNFDLPGKFHFVSLSIHILTLIPTGEPVNGCPSRGGGENIITSRRSQSPSLFFRSSRSLICFCRGKKKLEQPGASNTAQQLLVLRTEFRIRNFAIGNGLQEVAARTVLSKRSVLFNPNPNRPTPPSPPVTNSFHTSRFLGNNLQLYWLD